MLHANQATRRPLSPAQVIGAHLQEDDSAYEAMPDEAVHAGHRIVCALGAAGLEIVDASKWSLSGPVDLDSCLCMAIDKWHAAHPDLTIGEILISLEAVKRLVTFARTSATEGK